MGTVEERADVRAMQSVSRLSITRSPILIPPHLSQAGYPGNSQIVFHGSPKQSSNARSTKALSALDFKEHPHVVWAGNSSRPNSSSPNLRICLCEYHLLLKQYERVDLKLYFLIYSSQVFLFGLGFKVLSCRRLSPSCYDILPNPYNWKVALWRFYLA